MAGIFPYVRYTMDLLLHRLNIPKNYYMDTLILKTLSNSYNMDLKLVFQRIKSYNIDALLLKTCSQTYRLDTLLQKRGLTKTFNLDMIIK